MKGYLSTISILAVCVFAVLAGLTRCGRSQQGEKLAGVKDGVELAGLGAVRYCIPASLPFQLEKAQLLVDGSGSMRGFVNYYPRISEWSAQALSQVRGAGVPIAQTRNCYFSAGRGVHSCRAGALGPAQASGDTNLDQAIASAREHDLSLILTDGVAATGSGTGDCAGGADPACVGRALRLALVPQPGDPATARPGLWLIPMMALFDGPVYTEQFPPPGFVAATAQENVARETATNAAIGASYNDRRGHLVYRYRGPRALFALVVARNAELGRGFVAALLARAPAVMIGQAASMKEFQRDIAVLPPIEIYPGYLPPIEWEEAKKLDRNGVVQESGTVDLIPAAAGTVSMACPAKGEHRVLITLPARQGERSSGCIDLQVLPRMKVERSGPVGFDGLNAAHWQGNLGSSTLTLDITCPQNWRAGCGVGAPAAVWVGHPNFAASADHLHGPLPDSPGAAQVAALTTDQVAIMPHRVFGLRETIEKLYRELQNDKVDLPFAQLQFCSNSEGG